jgi:hypothetical protein
MGGLFLDIFVEYFFRVLGRGISLVRSHRWRVIKGTVLSASCEHGGLGCTVAEVDYEYVVDGAKYGSTYSKPFLSQGSGEYYAQSFVKGQEFKVRVKPGEPSVSIAEPGGWAHM